MKSLMVYFIFGFILLIQNSSPAQAVAVGPFLSVVKPRDIEPVLGPGLRVDIETLPIGVDLSYWTSQYSDNYSQLKARNIQLKAWGHLPLLLIYIGGGVSLNRFTEEFRIENNLKASDTDFETGYHGLVGADLKLGIIKLFTELDLAVITGGINTAQLSVGVLF